MVDNNPLIPKMGDLLDEHSSGIFRTMFFSLPGKIVSYNADETTAVVEIMMMRVNENTQVVKAYPALLDVPVFQLTGGDAGVNMPVAVGDPCLVVFADRDVDNWFSTGSAQVPNSKRVHSVGDGFAIVGFRPLTGKVSRPDYLAAGLYRDQTQISIKGNKVAVKNQTTDLLNRLQQLVSDINTALGSLSINGSSGVDPQGGTVTINSTSKSFTSVATDFTGLLYNGDLNTP